MQTSDPSLLKFIFAAAPIFQSVIQGWNQVGDRLSWSRNAQTRLGHLGRWFTVIDRYPQYIHSVLLFALTVAAGLALLEGGFQFQGNPPNWLAALGLFDRAIWIFVFAVLGGALVFFNLIPKLLLCLARRERHRPGYINAKWHTRDGNEAAAVNRSTRATERLAQAIVDALPDPERLKHRAVIDQSDLTNAELANLALVGCLLEGRLKSSGMRPSFAEFYGNLADAGRDASRPFAPQSIQDYLGSGRSYFDVLTAVGVEIPRIAAPDLQKATELLSQRYAASAFKLALVWWRRTPSIRTAVRRLEKFPISGSLQRQVVKLSIRWGVWGEVSPGPFVFPQSRGLARFLFNTGVLITTPGSDELVLDDDLYAIVASTESAVVGIVDSILKSSKPSDALRDYFRRTTGREPHTVGEWWLADEVDYTIWFMSRQDSPTYRLEVEEIWRIEGEALTRG